MSPPTVPPAGLSPQAQFSMLTGPPGAGKTAAVLDRYRQTLRAERAPGVRRRVLWLAPTQAAASDVRDALIRGPEDAVLDPGVMTFAGFAAAMVWDAGLPVRVVTTLQRRRLIRRVIAELATAGKLPYFAAVVETEGLVTLVDQQIAELKRRDIFVDRFRRMAERVTPRQRDLAVIYARYQERLTGGKLVDAEGLFRAARDAMEVSPSAGSGLQLVVVDGFTDFTSAQLEIIEVLAARSVATWVTLLSDHQGSARQELFAKPAATAERLVAAGADVINASTRSAPAWPALGHLERNLFRDFRNLEPIAADAIASRDRIQILAASSVRGELEEIADRVKRLLLRGTRPGDIVVAFRSCREVADRAKQICDDFGVPVWIEAQPRLAATALVRSLTAVLRLVAEDWPYRGLLRVAGDRSIAVLESQRHGDRDVRSWPEADPVNPRTALEQCVRQAQLPSGRQAFFQQLTRWQEVTNEDADVRNLTSDVVSSGLAAAVRLAETLDQLPSKAALTEWIAAVELLAKRLGLLGPTATAASRLIWSTWMNGLQSVGHIDLWTGEAARELTLPEFLDVAATASQELPCPADASAVGKVRVLSAEAARFTRPRHLFLAGLGEQSFPSPRGGQGEGDLEDGPPADRREEHRRGEMLLFYQVVTRPTESLTLSYPALDAKAQSMPPSPYLAELQRCFSDAPLSLWEQPLGYRQSEGESNAAAPTSRSGLRRMAVLRAAERKRELLAAMSRSPRFDVVGQSILAGIEMVGSRARRQDFGGFEGLVQSDAVRAILVQRFGTDKVWSASHLETYAACPFRFFGEQVLRLSETPELSLESDLARRGHLLHDTLAALYGELAARDDAETLTPDEIASAFAASLDNIAKARPGWGLDGALREVERRQIAAWAAQFAAQHAAYGGGWKDLSEPMRASHFEVSFGLKRRRPKPGEVEGPALSEQPLELAVGDQRVKVSGRIDRIDVGRAGDTTVFNVIDYKTGGKHRVNDQEIEAGRQLQLPLYALAAAELLFKGENAQPWAAGYWSVRGKGFDLGGGRSRGPLQMSVAGERGVSPAESWTTLKGRLLTRIGEIIAAIRSGWFPVFNEDPHCGVYCPYSTVCRVSHVRSLEKTWRAPVVEEPNHAPTGEPTQGATREEAG